MPKKKEKKADKNKPPEKKTASEKAKDKNLEAKKKKAPPPPACFTPEDLVIFKKVFKDYDEDNIDKVLKEDIPHMLRLLGFNPKPDEVAELYKQFLEDDLVTHVEFFEFLQMLEAKVQWGDDRENTVVKAVAFLTRDEQDTGICEMELLKQELFIWGVPFQDIEFNDFLKLSAKDKTYNVEEGSFLYLKFIENMNNKDVKFLKEPINFFKLDQKTLAALAIQRAEEEKVEQARLEEAARAKAEAKRQKLIADGLLPPE